LIEQRIQCVNTKITNTHSGLVAPHAAAAAVVWIQLASHLSDSQVAAIWAA